MTTDLIDIDKIDEAKSYVRWFVLWPEKWQSFSLDLSAYSWEEYQFKKSVIKNIPKKNGVYTFVIKPDIANHPSCAYLMYIGQTTDQNLRKRFTQYLDEQAGKRKSRPRVQYILRKYSNNICFICMPLDNRVSPKKVEDALLNAHNPPVNDNLSAEVRRVIKTIFV